MKQLEKSCDNCQDYIVCLASDTLLDEGACESWRLDFLEYQKFCNEREKRKKLEKENPEV